MPVNPTLDNEIRYALELSVLEPLANSVLVKVKDRLNSVRSLSLEAQHDKLKVPDYRRNVEKKFLFSCQSQNLNCDCELKNRRFKIMSFAAMWEDIFFAGRQLQMSLIIRSAHSAARNRMVKDAGHN